tara:strand:+ start:2244 stop:2828 length:585 start_codon:yes stop_codon:yes gene_type:complete
MFTGIIKNTGKIYKIYKKNNNCIIEIISNMKLSKKEVGSSISCSGACLTLEKIDKNISKFYISNETWSKTNFKSLLAGSIVNMEKSLKYKDRVSGHFVQGHIDTISQIRKIKVIGKSWLIDFDISKKYKKYIIPKGSISINGVSLTVSKITKNGFQSVIIPHTLKLTNLIYLKRRDIVNIEFDFLGKYIKNFLQ